MCDWSGIVEVIARVLNKNDDFKRKLEKSCELNLQQYNIRTKYISCTDRDYKIEMKIDYIFGEKTHTIDIHYYERGNYLWFNDSVEQEIHVRCFVPDELESEDQINNYAEQISNTFICFMMRYIDLILRKNGDEARIIRESNFLAARSCVKPASKR